MIFCGGNSVFEAVFQLVEADVAVQPVQQGVFLFLEAEVVQPHRVLDDPVAASQVMLAAGDEVGPPPDRQRACGTGKQTVVKGDHESGSVHGLWRTAGGDKETMANDEGKMTNDEVT